MGVAFVAHCLLNQNSKVGDGAHCAGVYSPVIDTLRDKGWRIEQMPCPELAFTGLNRYWAVREQLDYGCLPAALRLAIRRRPSPPRSPASGLAQGEDVVLVGVEGSPSMGVRITSLRSANAAAARSGPTGRPSKPAAKASSSRRSAPRSPGAGSTTPGSRARHTRWPATTKPVSAPGSSRSWTTL